MHNGIKCQPPAAVKGCFPKDRFAIDLYAGIVTCPASSPPHPGGTGHHAGAAGSARPAGLPLAGQCTKATGGRTVTIGPHEPRLAAARTRQGDLAWKAGDRATRPKVERKIGHLMRRRIRQPGPQALTTRAPPLSQSPAARRRPRNGGDERDDPAADGAS